MKKTKMEKGITLIALIITIVVLLILAAVAIAAIQNENILSHANNAAVKYNESVGNEQTTLGDYLNFLNNKGGSGNGEGSGSGTTGGEGAGSGNEGGEGSGDENGGSTSQITWTKTSEGDLTVGSTVVTSTGENFYVIGFDGENNETVKLLAKEYIDTTNLVQSSSAGGVYFSTEVYWTRPTMDNDYVDIVEPEIIPESHLAAKAAFDYGVKLGGAGRLMTWNEAMELKAECDRINDMVGNQENIYDVILYKSITWEDYSIEHPSFYWLGTAVFSEEERMGCVFIDSASVDSWYYGLNVGEHGGEEFRHGAGVRPVVEISKANIH